jgi:hypothetical protein
MVGVCELFEVDVPEEFDEPELELHAETIRATAPMAPMASAVL